MISNALVDLSPEEWLIALWLLAMGGFIGSFLNVVVYRLPAGMSVVAPRSRCPQCLHPIRWFDNVPVLSWFLLGGRCRDCRAAISPRYPLVEGICGACFCVGPRRALVGGQEPAADRRPRCRATRPGAALGNLRLSPCVAVYLAGRRARAIRRPPAAAAVVRAGPGGRSGGPGRLACVASRTGLAHRHGAAGGTCRRPGRAAAGAIAGGLSRFLCQSRGTVPFSGRFASLPENRDNPLAGQRRGNAGLWLAAACTGLFLGWQAACALVAATAVVAGLLRVAPPPRGDRGRLPLVAWLTLVAAGWILAWGFVWGLLVRWVALV